MSAALLLSLEEFLLRPERDDWQREELIEGALIVSPGAKVSHAFIVDRLREALSDLRQQGFVVANDFSCILPPHSMPIPDLAVVNRERWEQAARADAWLEESPELVVEVVSPSNQKLYAKAELYLDHGAEQVWIVFPKTRTVAVFTREGTRESRAGETLEFRGLTIAVSTIFL